ncbi:hypothetical protein LXT21_06410 [Myxococcus sp. K38C18041901]|uniref:hypothetical protein n=1 Tax=Myxococcus guangdongensis TaxID=2906760 RepID=UPI0020A72F55|nr:hypothetical protein [Myxococcus guangdongensis]MCP3058396.1 hypothetical protein [Myxococcus guangdongensis]
MRNVVRGLVVWALCSTQLGCGQEELPPSHLEPDIEAVASSSAPLSANDVGVIAPETGCPAFAPTVWIHMDNEDSRQSSHTSGWVGATQVNGAGNTTFTFCRVDGNKFKALSTSAGPSSNFALLKLGASCPAGSAEFGRYFDNEDRDNMNSNSNSENIWPNVQGRDTTLYFCLFTGATTPASSLPILEFEYGVFATPYFRFGKGAGVIFNDDEDTRNANAYTVDYDFQWAAKAIVTEGGNTTLYTALAAYVYCGDNSCNAQEGERSCPSDCTVCGNGICGPRETATSCADDCGWCGDGVCSNSENSRTCGSDCARCGDFVCNGDETPQTCPLDCRNCNDLTSDPDGLIPTCPGPNG